NANSLRLAELQRDVDLQSTLYRRHAENLAQTQVDQALEAEKISNINIVQPATYDVEPVRPRRLLLLGLGLVFALAGSLLLAWLAEGWQRGAPRAAQTDDNAALRPALRAPPSPTEAPPLAANSLG